MQKKNKRKTGGKWEKPAGRRLFSKSKCNEEQSGDKGRLRIESRLQMNGSAAKRVPDLTLI